MPARKTEEEKKDNRLTANMRFYSRVMNTPKEALKAFNNGSFSGTDINPMYRIQMLTELFGPVGFGWWTNNVSYDFVEAEATNEISVFCQLELYVKDPETGEVSQPIYGIGGNTYIKQWKTGPKASDEAKKMAYTDALSIACKALGIGHDIWYQNDKTKYTMYGDEPVKAEPKPVKQTEEPSSDLNETLSGIKKGIQYLTKDMSAEEKAAFSKTVIKPVIGSENYLACKDKTKLDALLNSLRIMAKSKAA